MRALLFVATMLFLTPFQSILSAGEAATRVGVCLSLTGDTTDSDLAALAGIRLRMEEWNAENPSKRIELVVRDTGGDPGLGPKLLEELVEREKVAAVIGFNTSNSLFEVADYARKKKIVVLSPSATDPRIGGNDDWAFRLLYDDEFQAKAMAEFVIGKLNMRRACAVVNARYSYSESTFAPFARQFEKLGGVIVDVAVNDVEYDPESEGGAVDFAALFEKLRKSRPETVFLPLHAPEAAAIVRESLQEGFYAHFCGADTWENETLLLSGGNNLRNSHYVSGVNFQSGTPEMDHFLSIYDRSNDLHAAPLSVYGYDSLTVILEAMRNGTDPETMRETLYGMKDFPLASGPITFDREAGTLRPAHIRRITLRSGVFASETVATITAF